jgi:hypothetical protein
MEAVYELNNAGVERACLQILPYPATFLSCPRSCRRMESRSAGATGALMAFFTLARVKIVPCSEGKTRPKSKGVVQKGVGSLVMESKLESLAFTV